MRMDVGDLVALFNGRDGEWQAEVAEAGKRGGILVCREQSQPQVMPPDLWLLFAPIKKARTDFIVEKAVEMGVRRVIPVQTAHTNSERIRQDRLQAHAFCDEALAGESGRLPDAPGPWAILIGPEGGFSEDERKRLRGMDCASPISLGPRILRADTAAVAALTLWQSSLGDWA
jgi:16S rRNA (uracil1498-N3)-methyltransferase